MPHHPSSVLQHSGEFREHDMWAIKVFNHHVASDQAQAFILERQALEVRCYEPAQRAMLSHGLCINVTPHSEVYLSNQCRLGLFPPERQDAPTEAGLQTDRMGGDGL